GLHLLLPVPSERPARREAELLEIVGQVAPRTVGVAAAEQDHGHRTATTPTTRRALTRRVATATPGVMGLRGLPTNSTAETAPRVSQAMSVQSNQVMADTPSGGRGWCAGSPAAAQAFGGSCSGGIASASPGRQGSPAGGPDPG